MISKILKEETIAEHQQAEKNNDARFIIDHSITHDQYLGLLYKNYIVYNKLENLIHNFMDELPSDLKEFAVYDKSDRLKRDLTRSDFNFDRFEDELAIDITQKDTNNVMQAIGILYVIEGSMLGVMMIANHLQHCSELGSIEEHHFFGGNPKAHVQRWKKFIAVLDGLTLSEQEKEEIIKGAKEAFKYFDKVFELELVI